ncbi:MAG: copper homeostasis protein CutC [Planctomycetales bacterium]|nr:copper homeostasis protein CutC [Planctomycetales bacterium]
MSDSQRLICEVCVESVDGAKAAERGGADRIELCGELALGGISPSVGLLRGVVSATSLPVMVMVRPRAGSFCYSADEVAMMETEISFLKDEGVAGVVFGLLKEDGQIDIDSTRRLCDLARPLSVTFHRGFDWARDASEALEILAQIGVERILTSGQEPTAEAGLPLLKQLAVQAGDRIAIMPGSGVSESNVQDILNSVDTNQIHFSAGVDAPADDSFRRENVPMSSVSGYAGRRTSESRVRAICDAARSCVRFETE